MNFFVFTDKILILTYTICLNSSNDDLDKKIILNAVCMIADHCNIIENSKYKTSR